MGKAGAPGLSLRRVCAGDEPELVWSSTCVYSGKAPDVCWQIISTFQSEWLGSILRTFLFQGRKVRLILCYLLLKEKNPPVFPFFSTNRVALWGTPWFAVTNWTSLRLRACWCVSSTSWKACLMVGKNGDIGFTFLVLVFGLLFKDYNWLKGYKDLKQFSSLFEIHVDFLNGVEIKVLIWKSIFIILF